MTRTKHGWHIPNTSSDDERFILTNMQCGGPTQCIPCGLESGTIRQNSDIQLDKGGIGWYEIHTREGTTHIIHRGEDGTYYSPEEGIEERHYTDAHLRGKAFKLVRVADVEAAWNRI